MAVVNADEMIEVAMFEERVSVARYVSIYIAGRDEVSSLTLDTW
jgi:hypothetical protein